MEEIRKIMQKRRDFLTDIRKDKEMSLTNAPEGALRINTSSGKTQFFHRSQPATRAGTYIPQNNFELARELAQKDYDQKVIRSIEQEIKAIDKYLSSSPETKAEKIYEKLHKERQKLIIPIRETDAQYMQRWEQMQYKGKEIDDTVSPLFTEKGERVLLRKIEAYEKNGIVLGNNLILTWETKKYPINQGNIRREINKYFKA